MIWKSHYLLPRLLTLAALTVLPLVVLHAYTLHVQYRRAQAATYRAVLGHVDLAARTVDEALAQVESQLRLVAHRRHAQRGDPLRCASLLRTLAQESRLVVRFDVHAATGAPACSSDATGIEDAPTSVVWVTRAVSQHSSWLSDPFLAAGQGAAQRAHVARLALTMDGPPGHGFEVYSALVSLQQLSELLSPAALPSGSALSLYDARGLILARNPGLGQWVGKTMPVFSGDASSWATTVSTAVGVDGVERLYARSRLRRPGLQLSAGVPTAGVTAPLVEEAWRAALIGLLVLGAGMAVAAYWSRFVGRSLQRLAQATAAVGSGDEGARIDDKLPGELGELASQFNLMLQALQARNQALQASQHRAVQLARLNEALSEAAHAAARIREPRLLLERICRICVDTGQARVAWICIDGKPAAIASGDPSAYAALLQPPVVDADHRTVQGARWHERCASGEVVVENDLATAAGCEDIRPLLLARGIHAAASLPFFVGGHHKGNLNLYADAPGFFEPDVVRLLSAISADLAFALEAHELEGARLAAEQALAQREQQLAGIIDTAMDAIITVDASYRIVVFNRAAAQMLQVDAEEMIGATVDRFIPAVARAGHHRHMERFAQGTARSEHHGPALRLRGVRASGEEFPLDATLVKFGSGSELLMTVTLRDVSQLQEAEAAKEAEARAAAASRAKSEFISHMSHELRTPLNAVLGFSQLLQGTARERLSPRELQQLDMIFLAGAQLRALIEETLDLSRIEAGRLDLRTEAVDVRALSHELLQLLEPLAQQQGVHLSLPPEPTSALLAHTDRNRLRQVLLNILSNAIKYNRRGGTVSVEWREVGADEVEGEVADTGLGMSAAQLERLFEPFNRLGREASGIEGTGIGMALTRRLVELLGGRLLVSSEPDVGTRVRVRLPRSQSHGPAADAAPVAAPPPAAVQHEPDGEEGPRGRILYVEDNPVNVMLVQAMLESWQQVELVSAPDVDAGVQLATALQPDLVLLDMHLGAASGHDFLARIRADSRTAALRVVALSASAMPHDVEAALRAGAMDYWTKPLDVARFHAGLGKLLSRS